MESVAFFNTAQSLAESLKGELTVEVPQIPVTPKFAEKVDAVLTEIHHNSGCVATETNAPAEALNHFKIFNEMMLKEAEDDIEGKDKRLAISWNELGNAYMMNKMWEKGEECFLQSKRTLQRLVDFSRVLMSFPLVNLGLAYWLMGRLDDAVDVLLEGLRDREAAYGLNDQESFMYASRHCLILGYC
jgi:tetratricopeptide (TPR) repeat protein